MVALTAALLFRTPGDLPEKAAVGYCGIPDLANRNLVIQSHTATLTIASDHVEVSTLTLVKNNGPAATYTVNLLPASRGGSPVPAGITATWANAPVAWNQAHRMDQMSGQPPIYASLRVQKLGTYALRIKYSAPIGKCGFDHKQRIVAYDLFSTAPIGTLMVTYSCAQGVVFHEPEAGPDLGWQIGVRGAFLKLDNYNGKAGLSYCAFYPGGFK